VGGELLRPGETTMRSGGVGSTRIGLGRAEQVAVVAPACELDRSTLGMRATVVTLYEETM
ncbi:MAG: hypothetical protein ACOCUS_06150, partial [Polyangiales bacterium]